MILINLLPHREWARKKRRELFFTQVGVALALGGLVSGVIYLWYDAILDTQRARNAFIQAEIREIDGQIKEVADLQAQLDAMKSRQAAVESLQADRNFPVHLLEEMVKQLPDGVYLSSLKQNGADIVLTGAAQSQERVSEFLRNLANNSPWLTKPQLVEVIAADVNVPQRGPRRVSNFSIRVTLVRSSDTSPPDGAESGAKSGSPAVSSPAIPSKG